MIVIDASALLEVLLRTTAAPAIEDWLFSGHSLHAPHLLDIEVAQVIRRCEAERKLTPVSASSALSILADLPLRRHPESLLIMRIWELRHNLSAYDAAYVALAEALDATLITHDGRLAHAAGHQARIELV